MTKISCMKAGLVASLGFVLFGFAAQAAECIYLKADAKGGNTGKDWANAYSNVIEAVTAAAGNNLPIHAAGGLYIWTAGVQTLGEGVTLAIYGGFPGLSESETLADRDPARYTTLFSGDRDLDDYWTHVETNGYSFTQTALKDKPLFSNGKLNLPPAFTDAYDTYRPTHVGSNAAGLFYLADGTLVFDGITCAGFNNTGLWCPVDQAGCCNAPFMVKSGSLTVNNCKIIGNTWGQGAIYGKTGYTITNSEISYNWGGNRGSGLTSHSGSTMFVTNCTFLSIGHTSDTSSQLISTWGGGYFMLYDCRFVRIALAAGANFNTNYGGPANIFGGENNGTGDFRDCVISNCYAASSSSYGMAMMSGSGKHQLTRCLVANNLCVCKPTSGQAYCMFGRSFGGGNLRCYDGTLFTGNEMRALGVAASSGSYALGIAGCNLNGPDSAFVNCIFDGNRATAPAKAGVTAILSRGVVTTATVAESTSETGLANCTFTGPYEEGVYEIVQFGAGHSRTLNIVNCLFDAESSGAINPVYGDVPGKINFIQSSILNCLVADKTMNFTGLAYDKVPFEKTVVDARTGRYVLTPKALVPALRTTCDVATNATSVPMSWVFRRPGSSTWEALCSNNAKSGSGHDAKLIADAGRVARPAGSFTRGAAQPLTATAETGKSVVVRLDPFAAGTVTGPVSQSFALDGAMTPVTANSVDEKVYVFDAWYTTNDVKISDNATLTGYVPTEQTGVVVGKFDVAPVTLTFSLDVAGTFKQNGQSTISISAKPGAIFPSVPEYTEAADWHVVAFHVPDYVPTADTTYPAEYVTKSGRRLYVVPDGAGKKDGSSWDNAYDSIETAYVDAARYKGEVWVKAGVYKVATTISLKANVQIYGGFAGGETDVSQADPETNVTVFTGDQNDNDYWGVSKATVATHKIWDGTVFNPPRRNRTDGYWPPSGNISDNILSFAACDGVATNNVFSGVVFTGFTSGTFLLTSGLCPDIVFRKCKFYANNANSTEAEQQGAVRLVSSCYMEDCVFEGCRYAISAIPGTSGQKLTLVRCSFRNCYGSTCGAGGVRVVSSMKLDAKDCHFYRNVCTSRGYQPASSICFRNNGASTVTDCTFEEDYNYGDSHGSIVFSAGDTCTFLRCRFIGNRWGGSVGYHYEQGMSACLCTCESGGYITLRDCYFARNSSGSGRSLETKYWGQGWSSAICSARGTVTAINTTFEENVSNPYNKGEYAGTILDYGGNTALIGCTIRDSSFSGSSTNMAEFVIGSDATLAVINTVVESTNGNYRFSKDFTSSWRPNFASSYLQGFDEKPYKPLKTNGYLYDVVTNGVTGLRQASQTNEVGTIALGVAGEGPVRGRPVWLSGTTAYIYDPLANSAKPWRQALNRANSYSSVSGLTLKSPVIPDAFGKKRRPAGCTIGPLESPIGLMLLVK